MDGEPRHPRIANLSEYVTDRTAHVNAGYIGGRYYLDGKFYEEKEFKEMFPARLEYSSETVSEGQIGR